MTGRAATAYKRFSTDTQNSYAESKAALKKRFEPESKKELYIIELQTRKRRKGEDWATFGEDVRILAEKAYSGLQAEAQEMLALNHFLSQIESTQVAFGVCQKKPASVDEAVQYTLELESYLQPVKPAQVSQVEEEEEVSVGAAGPARSYEQGAMAKLLERMERLESSLKSAQQSGQGDIREGRATGGNKKPVPRGPIICHRCGKEGHYARGCAARRTGKGSLGAVLPTDLDAGEKGGEADAIPALSDYRMSSDYHLHGAVGGLRAKFLVDTGAAVSLLSKEVWDKVTARNSGIRLEDGGQQRLVGVQRSPLKIFGVAKIPITLSHEDFEVKVQVAEAITTEAILGRDFLRQNGCSIDLSKNLIRFQERGITLSLGSESGDNQVAFVSVMLNSNLKLPARSEIEVMAGVPKAATTGSSWVVEGTGEERNALLVARSIVSPEEKEIPIRLMNLRNDPVYVKKGAVVAQMEVAGDVPTSVVGAAEAQDEPLPTAGTHGIDENKRKMLWELASKGHGLTEDEKESLYLLLLEYEDVFASGPEDFGRTGKTTHTIDTGDAHPIRQAVRRIPPHRREETRKLLDDMLKRDVIAPSRSPWASPIVLVKKKDGSLRFCVDYRKVNEVTRKDAYPIPRVDDTLDVLSGAQWFSTLDLISGYWQVE